MITTDLFPASGSISVGQTAGQYACTYTAFINTLTASITSADDFDGYYLGYCQPELLPSGLYQTSWYRDDANRILHFYQSTPTANYRIGYGRKIAESYGYPTRIREYEYDGVSSIDYQNSTYTHCFNQIFPEYLSSARVITITFVYAAREFNGATAVAGELTYTFRSISDFLSFVYDDESITVYVILNNIQHNISIKYSDIKDVFYFDTLADSGREFRIYNSSIQWRGLDAYNGSYSYNDSSYMSLMLRCDYTNEFVSDTSHIAKSKNVYIINNIGGRFGTWNNGSFSTTQYLCVSSPPTCDFTFDDLNRPDDSKLDLFVSNDYGNGGVVAYYTGTNQRVFCFVAPLKYMVNTLMLMWRVQINQTYSYQLGGSWATDVNENDQFLGEWKTGNITNTEFKKGLRPWQYGNIQENEFTPDNTPPYTPPSPSDDGTDSGGDDIRPSDWTNIRIGAANNFVTLYGMTAATVADFGRQMWANLADPAFWQMVGTAFTNDFSVNPADMMKYFISLRYFPFDVSDFAHSTATGIYVGRAATPIAPSTGVAYPIRVTNNVVQVDGGRLTIRRYYNDFRDYEPCTTVQIHVPFCGSVDVPASEVMGHEMDLTYKIDLQTGAMLAVLGVTSNTYYVIATLAGTCGATIPITANNNIEFLQRIATVGSGLIGGGVSGAVKGATVGGEVGAVVGAVAGTVGGGVGALAGLPPVTVHKQGNASGFANLGGVPYAYATVQRGRFERPANYGHTTGFACDFSATLGSLSGFTVCDNVDTSGLTCNADERDEIKRLLESGVYV